MKHLKRILFALFFIIFSCDVEDLHELCGKSAIINNALFTTTNTDNYSITDVKITGNCLTITISSSGCSGNSFMATLVDSEYYISNGSSDYRQLKLSLETNEACLALVSKEFSFDIGNLQTVNLTTYINLEKWNEQLIYNY